VTAVIIALNVLAFLFEVSLDRYSLNLLIASYGIIPDQFQYADLFTSMFLHGGWLHLIGNMWFLWIYGDNVEDVLGHGKFLLFYLLCGIAAGMTHLLFNPYSRVPTIGASGAIAGVMGAYMVKFPHSKILTLVPIFIFFTTMEISAIIILLYWFVIQIFSGIGSVAYSNVSRGGVAWWAHAGGFIAGIALVYLLGTRERFRHRSDLRW
jgi:membrane associated rhomboid family serine protease